MRAETEQKALKLANDDRFRLAYLALKNAKEDGKFNTVGPKRRKLILQTLRDTSGHDPGNSMVALEYERYLNNLWNLDPYGLPKLQSMRTETDSFGNTSVVSDAKVETDIYGNRSVKEPRKFATGSDDVPQVEWTNGISFGIEAGGLGDLRTPDGRAYKITPGFMDLDFTALELKYLKQTWPGTVTGRVSEKYPSMQSAKLKPLSQAEMEEYEASYRKAGWTLPQFAEFCASTPPSMRENLDKLDDKVETLARLNTAYQTFNVEKSHIKAKRDYIKKRMLMEGYGADPAVVKAIKYPESSIAAAFSMLSDAARNTFFNPNFAAPYTKENTMKHTPLVISTITYINGTPAEAVSDERIFEMIMERENLIKYYNSIDVKNRPERLTISLTKVQAEINQLKTLVDARGTPEAT